MSRKSRTIKVYCQKCDTLLYKYHKSGSGHLLKCYCSRIKEDYTNRDLKCPNCREKFAREAMIRGKPAYKIIQGKVYVRD